MYGDPITSICNGDGVGCDGYDDYGITECGCRCHSRHAPRFFTNDDVVEWHIPSETHRPITAEERAAVVLDPRILHNSVESEYKGTTYVLHPHLRSHLRNYA